MKRCWEGNDDFFKLCNHAMYGFIAQLVEHRTGIRGGHGFESCWSLDFFRLLSNCLNWKIYCDDYSSLWSTTAVQMYELFHIFFTSFHSSQENKLNKLTSLPMYGFIARLVEQPPSIRGGHRFESCWSLDFFRRLLSNCLNWKIYCNDHSSLWSTTAVQMYELLLIYFTSTIKM